MSVFQQVPVNYLLTSGAGSALTWTNAVSVSSMTVSSLGASNLTVSTLTTSTSVTSASLAASTLTVSSITANSVGYSTLSGSTINATRLNYSSLVGSSISTNAMTLSLTNASTQNTQIYQVATTNPTTSYTAIQASHVSTGTTNNALALNPNGGNVGVGVTTASAPLHVNTASSGLANGVLLVNSNNTLSTAVNSSDILQQWSESTGNGNNVSLLWNRTTAGSDWTTASQRFQARTDASWQGFIEFNGTNNNNGVTIGAGNNTSNPNNVSSVMTIKTGGNVGIGTTAPIAPLHVYNSAGISLSNTSTVNYTQSATLGFNYGGGSVGTRDSFRIVSNVVNRDNGAGPTFYDYGAQADLVFQRKTNNLYSSGANDTTYTEVMRLGGATGNVGIGTTAPAAPLHVNGISLFGTPTSRLSLGGGMPVGEKGLWMLYDSTNNYGHIQVERQGVGYSPLILNANGGNVGIGTTAPAQLLDITNATSATPAIRLQSQYTSAYMSMGVNVGVNTYIGLQAGTTTTSALGTPPFVVTSAGTIGIGTSTPGNKLDVAGGIQITTNASQPLTFLNSSGPYNWNIGGQNDGTFRVYAGAFNGVQVGWAGTSWSAISDRRLKEDIEPLGECLSKIVALNPVSYRMINRPSTLTKKQFGLIAQEVVDIIPDIVESSWNDTAQEDRYSLLYTEIVPFLIGAIKEQNDIITSQAAANSSMQTQLSSLIAWAQTQGYSASS